MNAETALKRLNCLAAAVLLRDGTFDEDDAQKEDRRRLIAEIVATDTTLAKLAGSTNWQDRRVVNVTWDSLWTKVQDGLKIIEVKV
jgi:hypothetical protein